MADVEFDETVWMIPTLEALMSNVEEMEARIEVLIKTSKQVLEGITEMRNEIAVVRHPELVIPEVAPLEDLESLLAEVEELVPFITDELEALTLQRERLLRVINVISPTSELSSWVQVVEETLKKPRVVDSDRSD